MVDKIYLNAYAKINLSLHIENKRLDGFHNIKSLITFTNLHDEVFIKFSDKNNLSYTGEFKPNSKYFKDDIILRVLKDLQIKKKLFISIKKNIPTKSGLASASTNAASLIKGLEKLNLIQKKNIETYSRFGSDIPACLYSKNCFIKGTGDKINKKVVFKKFYIILIKPKVSLSTKKMYEKFDKLESRKFNFKNDNNKLMNKSIFKNDFEKIARYENKEINDILNYMTNLEKCKFARMTGSGSCCYAVFTNKTQASEAFESIEKKYKTLWKFFGTNIK